MNCNELYKVLSENPGAHLNIMLPSGEFVPNNFHITEVGKFHKSFFDCGANYREVSACVLQVWVAHDTEHRLKSDKLAKIIQFGMCPLSLDGLPVEIEYSKESISQYPLGDVEVTPNGLLFVLGVKKTNCLAPDKCGVSCCKGISEQNG